MFAETFPTMNVNKVNQVYRFYDPPGFSAKWHMRSFKTQQHKDLSLYQKQKDWPQNQKA